MSESFGGEASQQPQEVLIGEPVDRPDGFVVSIFRTSSGIDLDVSRSRTSYSDDEVLALGFGNWQFGVARIAQASYSQQTMLGSNRPFARELLPPGYGEEGAA